ncbi:hypothetical protein FGB62_110g03 [Gracilaria domingensis]|nr:hypothetical protein FGB62_110g03 [Gracilaria domingensis]
MHAQGPQPQAKGRIAWDREETMALVRAAATASTDLSIGSGMSAAEHGPRIRAIFIKDKARPRDAYRLLKTGCSLDSRRWYERSSDGCRKTCDKIRAECTRYKSCYDRVISMTLAGNPGDEEFLRCPDLLYSDGSQSVSHLYDCASNQHYHIQKPFKFKAPFTFLNTRTTMLQAGKEKSGKTEGDGEEGDAHTMKRIKELLENSVKEKASVARENIALQREKLEWEMTLKVLGAGCLVSEEEKAKIQRLMRTRLLHRLENAEADTYTTKKARIEYPCVNIPTDLSNNNSDTALTLLQLSSVSK